jgi:hypothetical protein
VKLDTASRKGFERGESKTPRHVSGHFHGFMGCPTVPGMILGVGLPRRPVPVLLVMALLFPAIASPSTTPFCMAPRIEDWWRQPKPSSRARSSLFFSCSMHLQQRGWQISSCASCQSRRLSGRRRRAQGLVRVATSTSECRDHPRTAPAATTQRR